MEYLTTKHKSILKSVDKIKQIINQVRTFSRNQQFVKFDKIYLNQVIEDVLSMLKTQFKNHNIKLKVDLQKELGFIIGNKHKIEQVIVNLLTNAKDAVEEKSLKMSDNSYTKQISLSTFSENKKVYFEIRDNGLGISGEIQEKIFDPFFTTKDPEKGTGLGLSIVYGILEEMNAKISLESKPDKYTIFKIEFNKI